MNERIRVLAEQASEYVNTVYTPPVRSKTPGKMWEDGHVGWHTQFNQKFAELIVEECEQVSLKNSHRDDDMGSIIARQIKQHFGVEE